MTSSTLFAKLRALWSVDRNKPELLKAQFKAFSSKIPMMYFILLVNSWALAITHLEFAPRWLVIDYPIALSLLCVVRVISWYRTRNTAPTAEQAWRALVRTNRLAAPVALSFTIWSLMLFPYGDDYARAHVAFYMGISVVSCIFCLMYLRSAALTVALIVNSAFAIFFFSTNIPTFIAAAVNVALVTAAMLIVLTSHYRDFTNLIDAQVQSATLSNENFKLANLDWLTKIPNRRKFFALLNTTCENARSNGNCFALAILDLDGFKSINDLYGHTVGDNLLIEVGERLLSLCDENIHLARLGGDEFALITGPHLGDAQLRKFGQQVCETLQLPFHISNNTIQIAASIGIATFPKMASSAGTLYEYADYALYQSKQSNRGTVSLFSTDHRDQIHRDANIEQALRQANLEKELSVHFQPIVDVQRNCTIAFEALARWTSPILGTVSPEYFIPVAERMGIISQLTRVLLMKALSTAIRWPQEVRLSFNLSAYDLNSSNGIHSLIDLIQKSNFDPRRLDMEITETAIMYDLIQTKKTTDLLRQFGCGVTLDDFGTGYSSLSQLHTLSLTRIKIDRSFVTEIQNNPVSYKIVKSLLGLSKDMNLGCVVEGVETKDEMRVLIELGGFIAQGYLFSPPIPASEADAWTDLTDLRWEH